LPVYNVKTIDTFQTELKWEWWSPEVVYSDQCELHDEHYIDAFEMLRFQSERKTGISLCEITTFISLANVPVLTLSQLK
jgi:hypothetical protein